jgi:hypothetical protein
MQKSKIRRSERSFPEIGHHASQLMIGIGEQQELQLLASEAKHLGRHSAKS